MLGMANHNHILARVRKAAGGPAKIAQALGIKSQAVSQWDKVPSERVGPISALTNIPPHELRPDLFEAPKASEPEALAS